MIIIAEKVEVIKKMESGRKSVRSAVSMMLTNQSTVADLQQHQKEQTLTASPFFKGTRGHLQNKLVKRRSFEWIFVFGDTPTIRDAYIL